MARLTGPVERRGEEASLPTPGCSALGSCTTGSIGSGEGTNVFALRYKDQHHVKELWQGNELRRTPAACCESVWLDQGDMHLPCAISCASERSEGGRNGQMHAALASSVNLNLLSWETVVPCAC